MYNSTSSHERKCESYKDCTLSGNITLSRSRFFVGQRRVLCKLISINILTQFYKFMYIYIGLID